MKGIQETVQKDFLAAKDFFAGDGDGEPRAAVDLGDYQHAARSGRPLDFAGIADQGRGIEVAFDGPGGHLFAGRLVNDAEGDEVAVDGGAGFFFELAAGGFKGRLSEQVLAFGDGPRVFFGPEGPAGVDEEDLGTVRGATKEQDAGGGFGHGVESIIQQGRPEFSTVAGALQCRSDGGGTLRALSQRSMTRETVA